MPPPPEGLEYYPDSRPGIRRERRGRGFSYVAPDGTRIDRGPERLRLEKMGVPPAYDRVWMCPLPNGHLMATGFDARGRKQYRYHPDWHAARAETKFGNLAEFGRALPAIRRRIDRDLRAEAGEPDFALAAALALIDRLALRVGHDEYARENGSHGALTLRRRHLRLSDDGLRLCFTAKGGRKVNRLVRDRGLQRALEKARDLPGAVLLGWIDAEGRPHAVHSHALNRYLSDAGGAAGFTAKTFRTWTGTLAAFDLLRAGQAPTIRAMAEAAAERLHNTPAIARKSYIHPQVIAGAGGLPDLPPSLDLRGLRAGERALLAFLDRRGGGAG